MRHTPRWLLGAALTLALALGGVMAAPAVADERGSAVQDQTNADANISQLQAEVEGLDSDLAQLYVDLQTVKDQVSAAQSDLDAAKAVEAAAQREYEQVRDQLAAAQNELQRLTDELAASQSQDAAISDAVGTMARELYRQGETSPLTLVMTSQGSGDIADRAASASTMARAQSRALSTVRESITVARNQSAKQQATTDRISQLEAQASDKLAAAEAARGVVETKVNALTAKQTDLETKQAAWDKRKADAQAQLTDWQAKRDAAAAKIADIDAQNRQNQTTFSGSSSGALFSPPIPGGVVTSDYGWRVHPIFGYLKLHDGTDWGAACGTPQYAIRDGVVAAVYFDSGGGNIVTVNHGMINGYSWTSEHLHLSSAAVSVGQQVTTSTVVGYTGSTGNSTGCHLHLTIYRDGSTVNPLDYM